MEVSPDGAVTQLSTVGEKRSAYINAQAGVSKILAVWPGRWRSDLFIIDDLDAFSEKQSLFGNTDNSAERRIARMKIFCLNGVPP